MKEKIEIVAMETGNCDFVSVLPLEGAAITKDVAVMSVYSKGKSHSFHLIILGIIVHAIVLLSVFDIYFQSPVIHGIEPVYPPVSVVKRLVLIVADGLRADKCFYSKTDDGQWASSYLRLVMMWIVNCYYKRESS